MEAGTIVKWLKAEGDRVEKGEPLVEVDTDKATQEVEAEASGGLLKIAAESGEVPVGETIAVIGEAGESVPDTAGARPEHQDSDTSSTEPAAPAEAESATSGARHRDETATTRPQESNGGR